MYKITTTDFSKFGHRERKLAEQLLSAWNEQGLPEGFQNEEVTIMFNTHSGNVFLTNSELQVAMMNDGKLESYYNDPETGEEGFKNELIEEALINLGLITPSEMPEEIPSLIDGAELGYHERRAIEHFLTAWNDDDLPENFSREGIRIANRNGDIFLTNTANQVAMLDGYDVKLCKKDPETGDWDFDE